MPDVLLIGYGNPLRGDDGIGWRVAQWFEENNKEQNLKVITCHQLTPDLALDISGVRCVIFIDAREDGEPGEIRCEEILPEENTEGAFTHHVSPAGLLQYATTMYGKTPKAFLVTVTGMDFGYGEKLSEIVENQLSNAISIIDDFMDESTAE